ncbi:MAG: hypothetical protein H6492_02345 [Candidatus Paracaedibacteraceae bacterium]|nr:hypothetical protein [Candidatus Paracaedibacteraceae bacterium]
MKTYLLALFSCLIIFSNPSATDLPSLPQETEERFSSPTHNSGSTPLKFMEIIHGMAHGTHTYPRIVNFIRLRHAAHNLTNDEFFEAILVLAQLGREYHHETAKFIELYCKKTTPKKSEKQVIIDLMNACATEFNKAAHKICPKGTSDNQDETTPSPHTSTDFIRQLYATAKQHPENYPALAALIKRKITTNKLTEQEYLPCILFLAQLGPEYYNQATKLSEYYVEKLSPSLAIRSSLHLLINSFAEDFKKRAKRIHILITNPRL